MLCCTQGVNAILIVGHSDTEKVYHQHHIPCKIETTLLKLKQQQMQLGSYCELEVDGYTDFVFINRYGNVPLPHDINRAIVRISTEANAKEAEQAKKEIEGIKYIKTKTDMNDPEVVLQVYNKMIEQKLFETAVGYSYLKDLQEYLTTIPFIKNEDILPIPVTHPRLEASLKKQKREIAQKERVRAVRARQREKKLAKIDRKALETESSGKLKISLCVNAILVVCVVAMFAMTLTSDSPTIVDYQSKLLNRYASWEQELTEREKAVSEKEQELGIQVDTEQTDFTVSP